MKQISDLTDDERRNLLAFNFIGGPLDDVDSAIPVFTAFGLAIMAWSRVETHLDALLIHINKRSYSREIFDPKHPIAFSRKLELLRKWFRKHRNLRHLETAIDALAVTLKALSKQRNEYIHALLSDYSEDSDEIILRSIQYIGNDTFHVGHRTFGTRNLVAFAAASTHANFALSEITSKLFTLDGVALLRQS